MRADHHEALLEAVADESTTPFPATVLAGHAQGGPVRGRQLFGGESAGAAGVLAGGRRPGVDLTGLARTSAPMGALAAKRA